MRVIQSSADVTLIGQLRAERHTYQQIADAFGCTRQHIYYLCKLHGYKPLDKCKEVVMAIRDTFSQNNSGGMPPQKT